MMELVIDEYRRIHGLDIVTARVFSAFGPTLQRQVVFELLKRASPGRPLVVGGRPEGTRDFIHVRDVARAVLTLFGKDVEGDCVNVGTGVATSLGELAERIAALRGATEVTFAEVERPGDPLHLVANVGRLSAVGFRPQESLWLALASMAELVDR